MEESKHTIQEMSAATRLLIAHMAKAEPGKAFTFIELGEVAHIDHIKEEDKLKARIRSARLYLRKHHGMVFGAIHGVGVKRLDQEGIGDSLGMGLKSIHNKSRNTMKDFEAIGDLSKMPSDKRMRTLALASCVGAIGQASREVTLRRLEVAVQKTQQKLPLEETLKAFT